jgi:hypothetical protein
LKDIGESTFSYSGIKAIRIPNNVDNIGKKCPSDCEFLCKLVFESDSRLKEIDNSAFYRSGIKKTRILSSADNIGEKCES